MKSEPFRTSMRLISSMPTGFTNCHLARDAQFASGAHGFGEAVIGGWQLSGLFRLTSGFPVNISNGYQWPTNWQLGGNADLFLPSRLALSR